MGFRFGSKIAAALTFALVAASQTPARAEVPFAQMVVDADSGKTLHAVNPDGSIHPASLVKIMTLYMAFEAIDAGRMSIHERIAVSHHAATQAPSKLAVPAGRAVLVKDAMLAVVTKSAND
ncbi:MAG: D-alanyl-D-alanine carboxypeptidase, partial [Alphaproteobacteria bacterium]|nr:D-alanyl-D-alanine carboxypeptidase [Alphaproteobacteria bacterium]